jgi:hypothetical protein
LAFRPNASISGAKTIKFEIYIFEENLKISQSFQELIFCTSFAKILMAKKSKNAVNKSVATINLILFIMLSILID